MQRATEFVNTLLHAPDAHAEFGRLSGATLQAAALVSNLQHNILV